MRLCSDPDADYGFGHCKLNQTIREAHSIVSSHQNQEMFCRANILINLGAIDIMLGRSIDELKRDFKLLINAMIAKKLRPIITTIPYIGAKRDNKLNHQIYDTTIKFNEFLLETYCDSFLVIDLYGAFTDESGSYSRDTLQKYVF